VRNYSKVPPISEHRGLPADLDYEREDIDRLLGEHSFSWLSLSELLEFDYDAYFENQRTTEIKSGWRDHSADAGVGNGRSTTLREFLGPDFFRDLEIMRKLDTNPQNVRVVFGFDS
jgi:hypothetical protein